MTSKLFSNNIKLFDSMLQDINHAKRYIYLETYRFHADEIGKKFRDALIRKAKQGVDVKLLVDAWGSNATNAFFDTLRKAGGDIRFFREIKFHIRYFKHNHRRDHRKLLIIDDEISYIGSSNICGDILNWRELNLRLMGNVSLIFRKAFLDSFDIFRKRIYSHKKHTRLLKRDGFELIRDVPSVGRQKVKKKYLDLIKGAKRKVLIETPYLMPDRKMRNALKRASKRGVDVKLQLPLRSDVKIMDILRDRYLGWLHSYGVKIYFYKPLICHAKAMVVDDARFVMGSSNLDYRSFIQQYEIVVAGDDREIVKKLIRYFNEGFENSVVFEYKRWKSRHILKKFIERLLSPIRKYF